MLFLKIFTAAAAMLVTSATASEFFCGVNTKGGCCAQYFTNPFDQYASGVGCEFATAITPSSSTVGETEWSCIDGLNPGCCSLDLSKFLDVDDFVGNVKLDHKFVDEEMHINEKVVGISYMGRKRMKSVNLNSIGSEQN
ncbi:hypothetical protein BKA64DRAFT_639888 [Cadophora sp. MPI-SDFR-AT-0126]|nr:hypothetical protein BKA64DRAFT_639888 [Leotiomycetes sp. MPI-SDFR-AT-0126]